MKAIVFSKQDCRWCVKAKELLASKKVTYIEYDVLESEYAQDLFISNKFKTVPQIYIDDKHIGGYAELEVYFN